MTVDEFRSHDTYPILWARELENNSILRMVLQIMEENHPARCVAALDRNGDISAQYAALQLGETRGYSKYGNGLVQLSRPLRPQIDPGPTVYAEETQNG